MTAQATAAPAAAPPASSPVRRDKMARMAEGDEARTGRSALAATVAAIRDGDGTALVGRAGSLYRT